MSPRLMLQQCVFVLLILSRCLTFGGALSPNQKPSSAIRRQFFIESSASVAASFLSPAMALTADEAARQYDGYAASYDDLDGGAASDLLGITQARRDMIQQAKGDVLEIGVGTGLNLDQYVGSQLSSLTLVDISSGMLAQARSRVAQLPNLQNVPVKLVELDATCQLVSEFGPERFDTVLDSFSLCVMGNVGAAAALEQMTQVSKQNVWLLENTRSSNPLLGSYQDLTATTAAQAGGKGCVYNQNVGQLIRQTRPKLEIVSEQTYATGLFRFYQCRRTING